MKFHNKKDINHKMYCIPGCHKCGDEIKQNIWHSGSNGDWTFKVDL